MSNHSRKLMLARMRGAASCGYFDARRMVDFAQTYGLPLAMQVAPIISSGLKVDYIGLRIELEWIGKDVEAIESELAEVRFFCAYAEGRLKAEEKKA